MTIATSDIARLLGLTEDELMEQAVRRFLFEKRREVLQEKLEILARYQVESIPELENQVANGEVAEHPAWEDLITLENLNASLGELDALFRTL